jgi:hypothetical protein
MASEYLDGADPADRRCSAVFTDLRACPMVGSGQGFAALIRSFAAGEIVTGYNLVVICN